MSGDKKTERESERAKMERMQIYKESGIEKTSLVIQDRWGGASLFFIAQRRLWPSEYFHGREESFSYILLYFSLSLIFFCAPLLGDQSTAQQVYVILPVPAPMPTLCNGQCERLC